MEKEINKSFKYKHGKKTYFMAWVVEYCLFTLAMSLGLFNLIFGFQSGDIITGLLLAVGWMILAVIELATIPMAGSLRIAKGINKFVASLGLVGLLFLAAFTVYEFNEIASEYMTRGAREAAMKVENMKSSIMKNQQSMNEMDKLADEAKNELNTLRLEKEKTLEDENSRYKQKKLGIEEYYKNLITEAARTSEFPIYRVVEKKKLERLEESITAKNKEIADIQKQIEKSKLVLKNETEEKNQPKIISLESQIEDLDSQIERLTENGNKRIKEAKGGLLTSKEDRIKRIQQETEVKITEIIERKNGVNNQLSELKAVDLNSPEITLMGAKILELNSVIDASKNETNAIEAEATKRMDTPAYKEILDKKKTDIDRLYEDKKNSLELASKENTENLQIIDDKFKDKLSDLESASKDQSERLASKEGINAEISKITEEINTLIEETSIKHEKTMYYRMASWFSEKDETGFGKLPKKEDYNKVLIYIFAPIGVFFGISAITLAYLGTGFMYDDDREQNNEGDEDLLKSQIKDLKTQLKQNDIYKRQITVLEKNAEKNTMDLIIAKQKIFEAVKTVPQTISINMDEKMESNNDISIDLEKKSYKNNDEEQI